jgi:hypothetical protein
MIHQHRSIHGIFPRFVVVLLLVIGAGGLGVVVAQAPAKVVPKGKITLA